MNLKLNNIGPISQADISIAKINLVGGANSSGKSTVSKILYSYLKSQKDDESLEYLMDSEGITDFNDSDISFNVNFNPEEVFYIESISMLDLKDLEILRIDHIKTIKDALESDGDSQNQKINEILSKIQDIIKKDCSKADSSGIKEIGIIQILLQNGSLKENAFLIIDEPEANLHPSWQIKFAEILVLLVKELNIHIYLNSHSPMFIEAISLYTQYYGLLDETNFYLTENIGDKFNFKKINPKNMGAVYENLTKPYDELDKLKAEILFKG
ncbi:AAA family ATPase [Methanobrevibacter sp.]|uniref:AAA family ATPase n=1 Tax=Methanobrevibacter sp. TaxID=66852 RepID=UPI0025D2B896|nr:AAA family ATPase [Methanobrevibacter sp.]MBQ6512537.1 ATP-binding protein [Methanobrevibacter sp.]